MSSYFSVIACEPFPGHGNVPLWSFFLISQKPFLSHTSTASVLRFFARNRNIFLEYTSLPVSSMAIRASESLQHLMSVPPVVCSTRMNRSQRTPAASIIILMVSGVKESDSKHSLPIVILSPVPDSFLTFTNPDGESFSEQGNEGIAVRTSSDAGATSEYLGL